MRNYEVYMKRNRIVERVEANPLKKSDSITLESIVKDFTPLKKQWDNLMVECVAFKLTKKVDEKTKNVFSALENERDRLNERIQRFLKEKPKTINLINTFFQANKNAKNPELYIAVEGIKNTIIWASNFEIFEHFELDLPMRKQASELLHNAQKNTVKYIKEFKGTQNLVNSIIKSSNDDPSIQNLGTVCDRLLNLLAKLDALIEKVGRDADQINNVKNAASHGKSIYAQFVFCKMKNELGVLNQFLSIVSRQKSNYEVIYNDLADKVTAKNTNEVATINLGSF